MDDKIDAEEEKKILWFNAKQIASLNFYPSMIREKGKRKSLER